MKNRIYLVFLFIGFIVLTSGCIGQYSSPNYAKNGTYSNPELAINFNYPTDFDVSEEESYPFHRIFLVSETDFILIDVGETEADKSNKSISDIKEPLLNKLYAEGLNITNDEIKILGNREWLVVNTTEDSIEAIFLSTICPFHVITISGTQNTLKDAPYQIAESLQCGEMP